MNCIIIDDDILSRKITEKFVKKVDFLNLLHSFPNAIEALNVVKSDDDIDLIFLDVEMPELSGIDFLKTLKNPPQIIIVSAKEKYAVEAFEFDVTDYLLKPVFYPRFLKAVNKAYDRFKELRSATDQNNGIFIKKNSAFVRLKYEEILWVEALENYVCFNTLTERIIIHSTMKSIETRLPSNKFSRVHRSFIVNINKFSYIEDNSVVFKNGDVTKTIPIGKSYKDQLMRDINLVSYWLVDRW